MSSVATRYPDRIGGAVYLDAAYPVAFDNGKGMSMAEFQEIVRAPPVPQPGSADLASFEALQSYYERAYGIRLPEAALRQNWEALPDGRVGKRYGFPGSPVLMKGTRQFTDIPVPSLVVFANPQSLGPWRDNNRDLSVQAAVKVFSAKFEAFTRKQEQAFREAIPTARVVTSLVRITSYSCRTKQLYEKWTPSFAICANRHRPLRRHSWRGRRCASRQPPPAIQLKPRFGGVSS